MTEPSPTVWWRAALVVAALMGAAGVTLAAAAVHTASAPGLGSASQMLLVHALALIGCTILGDSGRIRPSGALMAIAGWILGGLLFAGDIALRAFVGHRLFPMAAPAGGALLIASWLVLAIAAAVGRRT